MTTTTLAPLPARNRRILARIVGRHDATDDQLLAAPEAASIEWRKLPRKAAVVERIATQACDVCESLAASGVEFAGTVEQAARVVTATAYAAWRGFHGRREDELGDHDVAALLGFADGIEHARRHRDGMPAVYREGFLAAVAGSSDPIDRMPLGEILKTLWPKRHPGGRIRSRKPARSAAGSEAATWSWGDDALANVPSIYRDVSGKPR